MTTIREIANSIASLQMTQPTIAQQYADASAAVRRQQSVMASLVATMKLCEAVAAPKRMSAMSAMSAIVAAVGTQQATWARALKITKASSGARMAAAYASSSATWAKAAGSNMKIVDSAGPLLTLNRTASSIMRPLAAHSAFSASTLEKLSRLPEGSDAASRLVGALGQANRELSEMHAVSAAMIPLATEESRGTEPRRIGRLNLLVVEREELTASAGSGGVLVLDGGDVVSLAARMAEKARAISGLIVHCNEASSLTGGGPVFKYTDTCVSVMCDVSWLVPRTKNQLGDFVDALYFALYEGAGSKHLRYIERGIVTRDECDFIWSLKHLRNKWLRHDPCHGADSDIAKSKAELKEALAYFGLGHIPTTRAEFRALHSSIVAGAVDFLERLLEGLQGHEQNV